MASTSGSVGREVTGETGSPLAKTSLPPPRPKSPPEYPDLYGKRREAARVQMLEREIGFLEAKIKFVEGVQPASKCCKEVSDYVVANSDPLIPAFVFFFFIWLDNKRVEDTAGSGNGSGKNLPPANLIFHCDLYSLGTNVGPSAATAQVAAALDPNAVTGHAAQIYVVARNRVVRAVHASEVVVVLVRTCLAAYPPVSEVALDRCVSTRRRAHVAAANARSNGHLVLNVPSYFLL
ncbi:unnamed protein product [Eruca vesicaria subsp. sativa]|uniref:G protein gamma domain-containing protein n=1 Tax=Eruca vesicaria subsp. sativa TaxID=29727 RepID=A0ABC8K2U8_ERUVS|nr:unnamed protein product [Eruca vesicaria subsp. sativa]